MTVKVNGLFGVVSTLDGGTVSIDDSWRPSPKVVLLLSNVCGLLTTRAISLQFAAIDGAQIDGDHVDPWVST